MDLPPMNSAESFWTLFVTAFVSSQSNKFRMFTIHFGKELPVSIPDFVIIRSKVSFGRKRNTWKKKKLCRSENHT